MTTTCMTNRMGFQKDRIFHICSYWRFSTQFVDFVLISKKHSKRGRVIFYTTATFLLPKSLFDRVSNRLNGIYYPSHVSVTTYNL